MPNVVLDKINPRIPHPEAACITYICRRTFGFQKLRDRISLSQFIFGIKDKEGKQLDYGTGLSRPAVVDALKNLILAQAVFVDYTTKGNFYEFNLEMDIEKVVGDINRWRDVAKKLGKKKQKQEELFKVPKKPKEPEGEPAKPSPHRVLMQYWFNAVQKTRGMKPLVTGSNVKNLKRVLDLNVADQGDFEKVFLYYLASPRFKNFAPDLSTCLSAGVMNGLLNAMRQDQNFWKDLDNYANQYLRRNITPEEMGRHTSMMEKLEKLKEKLTMGQAVAQKA